MLTESPHTRFSLARSPATQLVSPRRPRRTRQAAQLAALAASATACMVEPAEGERIADTATAVTFHGFSPASEQDVTVAAFNPETGDYESVGSTTSGTTAYTAWDEDWYHWRLVATIPSFGWQRLGDGHMARLRASDGTRDYYTIQDPWLDCVSEYFDDTALDFIENCEATNSPDTFVMTEDYPKTVSELLETCPSPEERRQIRADFNIYFDNGLDLTWSCTPGGQETSIMLSVYNAFRAMKLIRFDEPMPLINETSLYDWLRSRDINVHIADSSGSWGSGDTLHLAGDVLAAPYQRSWVDPQWGVGLAQLVGLIVHETRHTDPGGGLLHNCSGGNDSSLDYGGAWALQYYYHRWLADHSGDLLTANQRSASDAEADYLLQTRFCD